MVWTTNIVCPLLVSRTTLLYMIIILWRDGIDTLEAVLKTVGGRHDSSPSRVHSKSFDMKLYVNGVLMVYGSFHLQWHFTVLNFPWPFAECRQVLAITVRDRVTVRTWTFITSAHNGSSINVRKPFCCWVIGIVGPRTIQHSQYTTLGIYGSQKIGQSKCTAPNLYGHWSERLAKCSVPDYSVDHCYS